MERLYINMFDDKREIKIKRATKWRNLQKLVGEAFYGTSVHKYV